MSAKVYIGLAVAAALLLYQFYAFNPLQDDAFISFRYIRNFLDGFGLVFNVGERVEGYTNFFCILFLALLAKAGLPLIESARLAGVATAIGVLGVAGYVARRLYPQRGWVWISAVPFLLASNGALAYWAGSGLETGFFTLLVAAGGASYLLWPELSLIFMVLAALTRPEGILLPFSSGFTTVRFCPIPFTPRPDFPPNIGKAAWNIPIIFLGTTACMA